MNGKKLHERKKPAQGVFIPADGNAVVFITVCTKERSKWLSSPEVHQRLTRIWKEAMAWKVGKYILMPDHMHFFAAFAGSEISLEAWIKYWKSMYSKEDKDTAHEWLGGCWDRRMRREENYATKWDYVRNNPVRHGLVSKPEDWPYQGEIFEISW